jgi:hypothetical protein
MHVLSMLLAYESVSPLRSKPVFNWGGSNGLRW